MQHLIVLAWAQRLVDGQGTTEAPFARAFRNQALDFIATNPPRFGVNWRCPMDVAIRAANWIVAYGLFRAHGVTFDAPFDEALKRSLIDHGRHIVSNLEFYPDGRANHYFSDIAGLLFIAAGLPESPETNAWLAFAVQELVGETAFQFNRDGSNFEGSTCYHRLALEIAAYGTALVAGLPRDRFQSLEQDHRANLRTRPKRPMERRVKKPDGTHAARLERASSFISRLSREDGRVVQIGDNDNGRFLKPHPIFRARGSNADGPLDEDHLDIRGAVAAVDGLIGQGDRSSSDSGSRLDRTLVAALARGRAIKSHGGVEMDNAPKLRIGSPRILDELAGGVSQTIEILVGGEGLRTELTLFGYPDFGAWIFQSTRLHLVVRCGPASRPDAGGSHAHNDQLAIDLAIDGVSWIADPGSYLYCPTLQRRNRWRSVSAHAAPQWPGREPSRLDLGNFRLRGMRQGSNGPQVSFPG